MSLSYLFKKRLPINRKEVYYTATVLPCIVCADGFAHIHRFWKLLGLEAPRVDASPQSANIQFLTEYNAKQSIYLKTDRDRFPAEVISGETPDVLILVDRPSPLIVSIEAKMYDTVKAAELLDQLRLQRERVLEPLKSGIPEADIVQVALLPEGMGITAAAIAPMTLLLWEQIREAFADVTNASYFCGVLGLALEHYPALRSEKAVFYANMEAMLTGEQILKAYEDGNLEFQAMGRSGGSMGTLLAQDLASGNWRHRRYELRKRDTLLGNGNWFAIKDFVARVRQFDRSE